MTRRLYTPSAYSDTPPAFAQLAVCCWYVIHLSFYYCSNQKATYCSFITPQGHIISKLLEMPFVDLAE